MPKSVEIFFCYAREDELLRQGLEKQLRALRRQGVVDVWHDRMIEAGAEWERTIDQHLNTAQVILLLVSPDFMDSDYCYSIEMKRAMERHERGEARVIPVILRHVYWQKAPFGKLQALPTDGEPVVSRKWYSQDEAFFNVAEGIRVAVEGVAKKDQERVPQLIKDGIDFYRQKLFNEAILTFNQVLLIDGNNIEALRFRGDSYRLLSRNNEALTDFTRLITLEPNNAHTLSSMGEVYRMLARFDDALTCFNHSLSINPNNAFALRNRGNTYSTLGRYDEALTDLNRSLTLEPNHAFALVCRGETYRRVSQYKEALADLNRSLTLDPKSEYAARSRDKALRHDPSPL